MCDETVWTRSLPEQSTAQGMDCAEQAAVDVTLRSGHVEKVGDILDVSWQWVGFASSPLDSTPPRPSSAQAQHAGAPRHDVDRLAIAYEEIVLVMMTLEPQPRDLGCRA